MNDTAPLEPTCFETCLQLLEQWTAGNHTRELGLNLMFHCGSLNVEPPFLTGFDQARADELGLDCAKIFNEVHDPFALEFRHDAEMLYVLGLMSDLFPWALGNETTWIARSLEYQSLYALLEPKGLEPELLDGRGKYGKYFAHQLRYARAHPRT
jgi:hypothetical protein